MWDSFRVDKNGLDEAFNKCASLAEECFRIFSTYEDVADVLAAQSVEHRKFIPMYEEDAAALAATETRLTQEATPMRELTPEEMEKHIGLVDSARKLEYTSFLSEETFEVIKRSAIPKHPDGRPRRIISSRELCQWKVYLQKVKIRLVLRGFQDDRRKSEARITVDSPTLRMDSLRLIYQLAADHDYDIHSWDLKTAFLQGFKYEHEAEKVYWNPPDGFREFFGMKEGEVCCAVKSIYGLDDAPRRWYEKLASQLCAKVIESVKDYASGGFGATRHWLDPCLFMKHGFKVEPKGGDSKAKKVFSTDEMPSFADIGVSGCRRMPSLKGDFCSLAIGTHVDDLIATGTAAELKRLDTFLSTQFKVGARSRASDPEGILYRGSRIRKLGPNHITVDMREYEEREIFSIRFKNLPRKVTQKSKDRILDEAGQSQYRAIVGKCIWCVCQTRPDGSCMTSQASSCLGKATEADAIIVNKVIDHLEYNPVTLHYRKLADISEPRLVRAACDAAFKRKDEKDDKARGGYIMCIGTATDDLVGIVNYGTSKIHRVCKSPTGAEAITITGCGDQLDNFYNLLFWFYPTANPTGEILTDSFSVTSTQYKYCSEVTPNLTVDIAMIRQRARDGLVVMKHQLGEYMAADGLTKATVQSQKALWQLIQDNRLGTKGVEISKIEDGVRKRLEKGFLARTLHPNNLSPALLNNIANTVNAILVGGKSNGRFYENGNWSFD
jgi:hypothetical protein